LESWWFRALYNLFKIGFASVIEWLEFALFGFLAASFSFNFFVSSDLKIAWVKTFSLIFAGFISRPIGGLFFGYLGDRRGRSFCLKITPIFLTGLTFLMAFLPTYHQIGIFSPLFLVFLRFLQGFFIGGEYAGNTLYFCESGKNKYYLGSFASCCGTCGIFLASVLVSIMYFFGGESWVFDGGWRVAYLITGLLGIISIYLRKNLQETSVFKELLLNHKVSKSPILEIFRLEKFRISLCLLLMSVHATSFYFVFTYLPNLMPMIGDFDSVGIFGLFSLFLLVRLLIIPIIGKLADHYSGENFLLISSLCFLFLSMPLCHAILNGEFLLKIVSIGILAFLTAINAAVIPGILAKILRARTGYTGFAIVMNVGFGFFGGIVPLVSHLIFSYTAFKNPGVYLSFCALMALIGFFYKWKYLDGQIQSCTEERFETRLQSVS